MTMPLIIPRLTLKEIACHGLTLSFLKTAVSTINECEKPSIIANIVICFAVNDKEAIAPKAAYRFKVFPNTRTIAASPGKPNANIIGLNMKAIQSIIGVNLIIVITRYTGTNIFDKSHKVLNPLDIPRLNVSKVTI